MPKELMEGRIDFWTYIKDCVPAIKQDVPELYNYCFPKFYETYRANEYFSPKIVNTSMLSHMLKYARGYDGQTDIIEATFAIAALNAKLPIYWIDKEIGTALLNTTINSDIDIKEMHLPLEAGVFLLPLGLLTHKNDGSVVYLGWVRTRAGSIYKAKCSKFPYEIKSKRDYFTLFMYTETMTNIHFNITYDEKSRKALQIGDFGKLIEVYEGEYHHSNFEPEQKYSLSNDDNEIIAKSLNLFFAIINLMNSKSKFVEHPVLKKVVHKHDEKKEFWNPGVIGKNYRIRVMHHTKPTGSHASPRLHLVRGFMNTYYVGPKNVEKRETIQKWIEPYWRGVED